jgi:hypothetical protein
MLMRSTPSPSAASSGSRAALLGANDRLAHVETRVPYDAEHRVEVARLRRCSAERAAAEPEARRHRRRHALLRDDEEEHHKRAAKREQVIAELALEGHERELAISTGGAHSDDDRVERATRDTLGVRCLSRRFFNFPVRTSERARIGGIGSTSVCGMLLRNA